MSGAISTGAKRASRRRGRAGASVVGRLCVAGSSGLVTNTRIDFEPSERFSQWGAAVFEPVPGRDVKRMAPKVGLEPTTDRLTADCSTIELLWNPKSAWNVRLRSGSVKHRADGFLSATALRENGGKARKPRMNSNGHQSVFEFEQRRTKKSGTCARKVNICSGSFQFRFEEEELTADGADVEL